MLVVDNGDSIRGIASASGQLDFIVNGYVGTTATQLSDGRIANTEGDLYLSGADATVVTSITVVNIDSVARTFTLYLKPSGGTSRAISPVSLDLGIGHSFYTDGQRIVVTDKSGNTLSTTTVLAHSIGGSSHDADSLSNLNGKISDATLVDATDISSEIDGDISTHAALATVHQDAPALIGTHAADIDAHVNGATAGQLLVATGAATAVLKNTGVILVAPDLSGVITAAALLTMPGFAVTGNIDATGFAVELDDLNFKTNNKAISAPTIDGANIRLRAKITGGAMVDVGRIAGAADPFIAFGAGQEFFFLSSGTAQFGAFTLAAAVTLNGQVFDAGAVDAIVNTTGSNRGLSVVNTQDGQFGATLFLEHVSGSAVANDWIGTIRTWGRDDVNGRIDYHQFAAQIEDNATGAVSGKWIWRARLAGTFNDQMTLSAAGALWTDAEVDTLLYKVAGTQVVSAQGAAVANPTDAASTQARLIDLLGRLRTHGMIAT